MGINDKIDATAKDAEGRIQAAAGELTDDPLLKAKGEAKQVQAKVMNAADDLGDKVAGAADAVGDKVAGAADVVGDKVADAADAVGDKVADAAQAIGNVFKGLTGKA
jgi:uncharacterized protein YjbJ (UPF0337 family)